MSFTRKLKEIFGLGSAPEPVLPSGNQSANQPPEEPVSTGPVQAGPRQAGPGLAGPPPAPQLREGIIRFIVEKLAPYANETDNAPLGMRLWVRCGSTEEEELSRVAVYAAQPGQFQNELERHLANQYIRLSPNWQIDVQISHEPAPADYKQRYENLALMLMHRPIPVHSTVTQLRIRALTGQTSQESYLLDPMVKSGYCIGRGQTVQTASGRVRTNDIVFLDADDPQFDPQRGDANLAVSRQHASIHYDAASRRFRLFADAGGRPENGNKTKLLHEDDTIERVDMPDVGHTLKPGDQIELGGEAILLVE